MNIKAIVLVSLLSVSHNLNASNEPLKCFESFSEETKVARPSDGSAKESFQGQTNYLLIQKAIWQYKSLVLEVTLLKRNSSASASSIAALNSEIASRKRSLLKAGVLEKTLLLTQKDREYLTSEIAKRTQDAHVQDANSEAQTQIIESDKNFKKWQTDETFGFRGNSIDVSPDGRFMAIDDEITELSTGRVFKLDFTNKDYGKLVKFSLNSQQLATSSGDGTIYLWEVPSGKLIKELTGPKVSFGRIDFSLDSHSVAAAPNFNAGIWLWDGSSNVGVLADSIGSPKLMKFSPVAPRLAIIESYSKLVKILSTRYLTVLNELKGHEGNIISIEYSADGNRIATSAWDNTIRIWDTTTFVQKEVIELGDLICETIARSGEDHFIAGLNNGEIREYRFSDGKGKSLVSNDLSEILRVHASITAHGPHFEHLSLSNDGDTMFATWLVDLGYGYGKQKFVTRRWKLIKDLP